MKPTRLLPFLAATSTLFFSHQTAALETLTVTASRIQQPAEAALASVTLITRQEIEASQASDLVQLFSQVPGLEIVRSGGPGQISSIFTRGTESDHTLVLLDGVKINPGTLGSANLGNLSLEMIERIEIVKGPHSTLYGSEALGGVIQIFTRKTGPVASFYTTLGEDSTRSGGVQLFHTNEQGTQLGLGVDYTETDGFPTLQNATIDSGFDRLSVNAQVTQPVGDNSQLSLSAQQHQGTAEYLGKDYSNYPAISLLAKDQDYLARNLSLAFESQLQPNWHTRFALGHFTDELEQNQSDDFANTQRTQFDWENQLSLGEHQLTTGLSWQQEAVESLSFGTGFDKSIDSQAIYLQDALNFGVHSLILAARYTHHEQFGGHTTWETRYGYQVNSDLSLYASAATGFRAPSASDLYGYGGNPNLNPETATNLEVGLKYQLDKANHLSAALFQNRIEDLINFVEVAPYTYQGENIDKATIKGLELSHRLQQDNLSWTTAITLQSPKNRSTDTLLLRRAQRTLSSQLHYRTGRYTLGGEWLAQSRKKDTPANVNGYGIVNLTLARTLTPQLTLEAKVLNVGDKAYETVSGYNTQGRAAYLTLRGHF